MASSESSVARYAAYVDAFEYDGNFDLGFLADDETCHHGGGGSVQIERNGILLATARPGDWLVRNVLSGEIYSYGSHSFRRHYQPVEGQR